MPAALRRTAAALLACALPLAVSAALAPSAARAAEVRPTPVASWGVDGPVYATAVLGDTVVVGGSFAAAVSSDGRRLARANLAAFSLRTGEPLRAWRADTDGAVRALAARGRAVWVGGAFTRIDGVGRARLARVVAASGEVDRGFRARVAGGAVLALRPAGPALFVGGAFRTVGGTPRAHLARVRAATGRLADGFRPSVDGAVRGIALAPRRVYLAGDFARLGGTERRGVGAVARATGVLRGPAYASSVRPSFGVALSTDRTRLLVAAGEYANALVAWDPGTGERLYRQTAMGDVQALAVQGDRVYFGFHEGFGGNTSVKVLAASVSTGALDPDFRPSVDSFWGVRSITATADSLVIGGEFTRVDGLTARGWARFRP